MIVFQVSDDESSQISARALAGLNWTRSSVQSEVRPFFGNNSMQGASIDALRQLVFIGHASTSNYGDYSADEFAEKFASDFIKAGHLATDKLLVEDIFVIGCGIGLAKSNGKSLAQEIANKLAKKGFINLKVHAIANPDNIPPKSEMIVEVVNRAGIAVIRGVRDGHIKAYILNSVQSRELEKLESQLAVENNRHQKFLLRQRIKDLQAKGICFIQSANPVEELQKPQNIFIPGESVAARKERIADHPYTKAESERLERESSQISAKQHTIGLLLKRQEYELRKLAKAHGLEALWLEEVTENLDLLINALKRSNTDHWRETLKINLHIFKLFGREKVSTTYRLLVSLAYGLDINDPLNKKEIGSNYKKAEHLIKDEKKSIEEAKKREELQIEANKARAAAQQAKAAAIEADKTALEIEDRRAKEKADKHAKKAREKADEAEKKADKKEKKAMVTANDEKQPLLDHQHDGSVKEQLTRHIATSHDLFNKAQIIVGRPVQERINSPQTASQDSIKFDEFKNRIAGIIQLLSAEIKDRNRCCCFSFFYSYEIETKTQKRDALTTLSRMNNLEDLQRCALQLTQNKRVMRSKNTFRVSDLLRDIVKNQPLHGYSPIN